MKKIIPIVIIILIIAAALIYLLQPTPEPKQEPNDLYQGVSDSSLEGYYEMSKQINPGTQNKKEPEYNMSEILLNKDDGSQNLDQQSTIPVIKNERGI